MRLQCTLEIAKFSCMATSPALVPGSTISEFSVTLATLSCSVVVLGKGYAMTAKPISSLILKGFSQIKVKHCYYLSAY